MNIGRLHAPSGLEVSSRGLFHDLIKNNIDNLYVCSLGMERGGGSNKYFNRGLYNSSF